MIEWFLRHGHHCQRTSFERVFEFVHWVALNESDTWRDGSMRSLVLRLRSLGDNESEHSKSLYIWTLTVVDVKFQDSNLYQENMVSALEQWRRSAWDPKNVGAVVAYQCWPIGPHGPFVAFLRNQGTWIEVLSSWPPHEKYPLISGEDKPQEGDASCKMCQDDIIDEVKRVSHHKDMSQGRLVRGKTCGQRGLPCINRNVLSSSSSLHGYSMSIYDLGYKQHS